MNKPKYLISACLCGIRCRYDGGSFDFPTLRRLVDEGIAVPFCAECAGGLPTPRIPCEIVTAPDGTRAVINACGEDQTEAFENGAQQALEMCKAKGLYGAILKNGSPSCGVTRIYDGTHTGHCIAGRGITAALLADNGITLYTEEDPPTE